MNSEKIKKSTREEAWYAFQKNKNFFSVLSNKRYRLYNTIIIQYNSI